MVYTEEGEDDVKSAWPSDALGYTHVTMAVNSGLPSRKAELIPEIRPQFRLRAATRPHEAGIASNRGSECRGEYVLESCTHNKSAWQVSELRSENLLLPYVYGSVAEG